MGVETFTADKGSWSGNELSSSDMLERIRKRYDYMLSAWKEIRDQAEKCQQALSVSGPWSEDDRDVREKNGRPCIHLDQLTQYISALVNQVRSEPIAIKVEPSGEGSDENTADLRARRIRAIEYESNATQAYETAFESAVSMGFGVFSIGIDYKSWDSMQRVIKVQRISNSWSVIWDPDCKEADGSDMKDAFEIHRELKDDFQRNHPDAQIVSFGKEETRLAGTWMDDDSIQVAKYWYIDRRSRKVFFIDRGKGIERFFGEDVEGYKVDEKNGVFTFKDGTQAKLIEYRDTEQPIVKWCLTNGLEILEEGDWTGKEIPIIPVIGRETFIRSGNKIKKTLSGYIDKAIDGQKLFNYAKSNSCEVVGMTPKTPWLGYKGQFSESYWSTLHQIPRAFAEVEPVVDGAMGQLLPLPQRQVYEPPVQALEMEAESARRAIQAAVASYGYTRLDDTNVKSGVALKQLDQQRDLGSYHLVDNYKCAIRRAGRIINDLLDDVENQPMQVSLRGLDETQEVVGINQPGPNGKRVAYRLTEEGQHEVTLSTGPSFQSQKEEGMQVFETLVGNFKNLPLDPAIAPKLLAELIRGRSLGPTGDRLIEILNPQKEDQQMPPQVQQAMAQMQQQLQALNAYAQQKEAELADMKQKFDGKVLDNETKKQIAALQADVDRFKIIMDANMKHEQLSSTENIKSAEMHQENKQMRLDAHQLDMEDHHMEMDEAIRAMSEDNKVQMADRQAEMQSQQEMPE